MPPFVLEDSSGRWGVRQNRTKHRAPKPRPLRDHLVSNAQASVCRNAGGRVEITCMNIYQQPLRVGHLSPTRQVPITAERVSGYCRALGLDPSGFQEQAPSLLLHSECYEDLSWYLLNIWGNLHARQIWETYRPLPLGEQVEVRGFVRERYRKRSRDYVVKETWVLDAEGHLINRGVTHQSFLIEDSKTGEAVSRAPGPKSPPPPSRDGVSLPPLTHRVTDEVCMAFSGPTRNYHTDRKEALALGFPDIVVQGMLPICLLSELLAQEFGQGWRVGGKMDVKLVGVLWAGEEIQAKARVVAERPEADATRKQLLCEVSKSDGTPVIVGEASALAP